MRQCNRRDVLKVVGIGISAAGVSGFLWSSPARADRKPLIAVENITGIERIPQTASLPESTHNPDDGWRLIAPLKKGSSVGDCKIIDLSVTGEIVVIKMSVQTGGVFDVKICQRDGSKTAPKPVARSSQFDFFIANGGKGNKSTTEPIGTSVMKLASLIEKKGMSMRLHTLQEHWQQTG